MNLLKMNKSFLLILCSIVLTFSACKDEEPVAPKTTETNEGENIQNGFTLSSETYSTPTAYLVYHSTMQYDPDLMEDVTKIKNQFSFLLMDGKAIAANGKILYSSATKHCSYHHFRDFGADELYDDIASVSIDPDTYTQSPSSTARVDISGLPQDITEDGVTYGDPVFAGTNYPMADGDIASFKINSISIDHSTMKGTIDCEYSIASGIAGDIIGNYSGSFDILIED